MKLKYHNTHVYSMIQAIISQYSDISCITNLKVPDALLIPIIMFVCVYDVGTMIKTLFLLFSIYILTLFCLATTLALLYFLMICLSKKYVNVLYAANR